MSATRFRQRSRARRHLVLQKPRGVIHPRVQAVGPEHFGIVCCDCAKARSKWMRADFYGKVLIPPTIVAHNRVALAAAIAQIRQAMATYDLKDMLVAIERTGQYHHVVQRAFAQAGFETRIVHPFTTKQYRQPSDPGNKTDDTDLAAIHRAAVGGFALLETPLPEREAHLQLLIRHRRDLVQKRSLLYCQMREHLEAVLPGYANCFSEFWDNAIAWCLLRQLDCPQAFHQAGAEGLCTLLRQHQIRFQFRTVTAVLNWAEAAAAGELAAPLRRRIALDLNDDRCRKTLEIQAQERASAALLARTP